MKKLTLFAAALACATIASAQTVGNPADPNNEGGYIVAYDMANGKWCDANPEIDETFVFAIDFTGTGLEEKIKTLPSPNRAGILGRSGAFDIYNNMNLCESDESAVAKADGRLFPIKDNIYGMTCNLYQLITSRMNDLAFGPDANYEHYKVCEEGVAFKFADNVFAFGWSESNPGQEWWDAIGTPVQDVLVWTMAPYTGKKTGKVFTYGDLEKDTCPLEGLDNDTWLGMVGAWGGYATPQDYDNPLVAGEAGVTNIADDATLVGTEYFDLAGRRLSAPADNGVSIRVQTLSNGSRRSVKILK